MYVFYSYIFVLMQVKGMLNVASPLLALPGFDVVEGTAIDWIHVVCSGILNHCLTGGCLFPMKSTLLVIRQIPTFMCIPTVNFAM